MVDMTEVKVENEEKGEDGPVDREMLMDRKFIESTTMGVKKSRMKKMTVAKRSIVRTDPIE